MIILSRTFFLVFYDKDDDDGGSLVLNEMMEIEGYMHIYE